MNDPYTTYPTFTFTTPTNHAIELRAASEQDASLVWSWWTAPHVVGKWATDHRFAVSGQQPPHDARTLERYFRYCHGSGFVEPALINVDGVPTMYVEFYPSTNTPLPATGLVNDTSWGCHAIIGDPRATGKGIGEMIGVRLVSWLFDSHPSMTHMVGDPQKDNVAMGRLCQKLGMTHLGNADIGYKVAAIYSISKQEWFAKTAG